MEHRNVPDPGDPGDPGDVAAVFSSGDCKGLSLRGPLARGRGTGSEPHVLVGRAGSRPISRTRCAHRKAARLQVPQVALGGGELFLSCGWTGTVPTLEARASGWRVEKEDGESGGWFG